MEDGIEKNLTFSSCRKLYDEEFLDVGMGMIIIVIKNAKIGEINELLV